MKLTSDSGGSASNLHTSAAAQWAALWGGGGGPQRWRMKLATRNSDSCGRATHEARAFSI